MSEIEAKIPFNTLDRCSSKHNDYHHPEDCICAGSGVMPTQLGYEMLRLIKWAMEYSPQRLTKLSCNTLQEAIDFNTEQQEKREAKRRERNGRKK